MYSDRLMHVPVLQRLQPLQWLALLVLGAAVATWMALSPVGRPGGVLSELGADARPGAQPDFRTAPPYVICGSAAPGALHDPLLAVNADGSPRPVAEVVSSEPLAHAPGKRITIAVVTFPPGSHSPPHVHGGTVNVWVLKGGIRSQLNSGPIDTFGPGGTFFEPLGGVHTYSGNVSAVEEAQVLAIFVHEEGATLTTYLE